MVMSLIESLTRIKNAVYGREVREAIHDGVFRANQIADGADTKADNTQIRQDAVEAFNNQVVQEMTDKDVISAPEIIQSRKGEANLNARLDKEYNEVSAQLDETAAQLAHMVNVKYFGAIGDGLTDDTVAINETIEYVHNMGGGDVIIPNGTYLIKAHVDDGSSHWTHNDKPSGIMLKDNVNLMMTNETILKEMPHNIERSKLLNIKNVKNAGVFGGVLIGDRYEHYHENENNPWKMWQAETNFEVGDLIFSGRRGYSVETEGKSGTSAPTHSGVSNNGTISLKLIVENVGEWGYGINVNGSQQIHIENVTIKDFWGDGIVLQNNSKQLTVKNVETTNNRRQGCSIISLKDSTFENCAFLNTNGTAPEAGVDIEPEANEDLTISVDNVSFNKCNFNGNNGRGFLIDSRQQIKVQNISIENSEIRENRTEQFVLNANGGQIKHVTVRDSLIDKNPIERWGSLVRVTGSTKYNVSHVTFDNIEVIDIETFGGGVDSNRVVFKNCSDVSILNSRIEMTIPYSTGQVLGFYMENVNHVTIDNSIITGGNQIFYFNENSTIDNVSITNSYFDKQLRAFLYSKDVEVSKLKISDNTILTTGDSLVGVIEIEKAESVFITNNYITAGHQYGLSLREGVLTGSAIGNLVESSYSVGYLVSNDNVIKANNKTIS